MATMPHNSSHRSPARRLLPVGLIVACVLGIALFTASVTVAQPSDIVDVGTGSDVASSAPDVGFGDDGDAEVFVAPEPDAELTALRAELQGLQEQVADIEVDGAGGLALALVESETVVSIATLTSRIEMLESAQDAELVPSEPQQGAEPTAPGVDRVVELAREAELAFDLAVDMEERAENEELRTLRRKERETAGKILALTRTSRDDLQQLHRKSRSFDERYADLLIEVRRARLDEAPFPAPAELRPALVDLYRARADLTSRMRQLETDIARTRERLAIVQEAYDALAPGGREVRERERAVLAADRTYRDLKMQLAEAELALVTERLDDLDRRRRSFERGIRGALASASASERRSVNGLSDASVELLTLLISDRVLTAKQVWWELPDYVDEGIEQLRSIDFWAWLAGLFLSLLPLLVFLVFNRWIPAILDRLTDVTLQLASARRNPRFVGRAFEVLAAVAQPVLNYAVVMVAIGYIAERFSAWTFVLDLVTAYFVYRIGVSAAEVARPTAERLARADEDYRDLIERLRTIIGEAGWTATGGARELRATVARLLTVWVIVRSAQIVVDVLFGFTLLGTVANGAGAFVLFVFVLQALSQWRAAIARLFARVAPERFAPTVRFVQEHAEKWYGIVIVAFALVYIVTHEVVMFVRRFVLSTSWFRSLSRVVFRARFQRRLRDRAERSFGPAPPDYIELFTPASEIPGGRLARPSDAMVDSLWSSWRADPRGAYVICAPPGCGKSAELSRLRDEVVDGAQVTVIATSVEGRMLRRDQFVDWLAGVAGLDVPSGDQAALIAALMQLEPHAFFIDDANRTFARTVEGYDAYESLTSVLRATAARHFWCIGFDAHAWRFVNYAKPRAHRFADVVTIPPLELDETMDLIMSRHRESGFELELGADNMWADPLDREEELRGFTRYLYETTGGNLASTLALWRSAVKSAGDDVIAITLDTGKDVTLPGGDMGWFLLAAIIQHGPLTVDDLVHIENLDEGEIAVLTELYLDAGILERVAGGEVRIAAQHYPRVTRQLVGSNFLYG